LAEVYVWKSKHIDEDKIQSGDLFEIEITDNLNWGWEINKSDAQIKGGENYTYRLWHLNSGRLVGLQTIRLGGGEQIRTLGLLKNVNIDDGETGKVLDELSVFYFNQTAIESDNKIRNNQCVKI